MSERGYWNRAGRRSGGDWKCGSCGSTEPPIEFNVFGEWEPLLVCSVCDGEDGEVAQRADPPERPDPKKRFIRE